MSKEQTFENLTPRVRGTIDGDSRLVSKLERVCSILKDEVDYYDWVGFYLLEEGMLHLGPFVGDDTEHDVIEIGRGICGQSANLKATFIIGDVSKEENYLSCGIKVKSEIVVPVIAGGKLFGVIDIDSHKISAFNNEDKVFLGWIAKAIASIVE